MWAFTVKGSSKRKLVSSQHPETEYLINLCSKLFDMAPLRSIYNENLMDNMTIFHLGMFFYSTSEH